MKKNRFPELIAVLSGIFLTLSVEAIYQSVQHLSFPAIAYFSLLLYSVVMIWLVYVATLYCTEPDFQINPWNFFIFPFIPAIYVINHIFGAKKHAFSFFEPFRPAIDVAFMFGFLLCGLAFQLETSEIVQQVSQEFVPFGDIAVTVLGIFLLYLSLEDWERIKANKSVVRSLGGISIIVGAWTVYALFGGTKPALFWNQWVRFGVFVPCLILLAIWFYKVNKDAKYIYRHKTSSSEKNT